MLASPIFHVTLALALTVVLTPLGFLVLRATGADLEAAQRRFDLRSLAVASAVNLLFVVVVLLLVARLDRQPVQSIGFTLSGKGLLLALLAAVLTFVLALGLVWVLRATGRITVHRGPRHFLRSEGLLRFVVGLAVLFIAAFQEEVLFRGYLLLNLSVYGLLAALHRSTRLFTVWHFLANRVHVHQVIQWALGGLSLACVYLLSGSVWVAGIVHFAHNLANVLVLGIQPDSSLLIFDKPIAPDATTVYGLVLAAALVLLSWGLSSGRQPPNHKDGAIHLHR